MNQSERRLFLINKLLQEQPQYRDMPVPKAETEQKRLPRSLMNIRRPKPIGEDFLAVQDEYLQAEIMEKGITEFVRPCPDKRRHLSVARGYYNASL